MDCHAVFKTARNDKVFVILGVAKYPYGTQRTEY